MRGKAERCERGDGDGFHGHSLELIAECKTKIGTDGDAQPLVPGHHRQRAALPRLAPGRAAAHARERARSRRGSAEPRGVRRARQGGARLACARQDRRDAEEHARRRDAAGAVGKAGRPPPDASPGAAGHHGELQPRRAVGEGRSVLRARGEEPDLLGRAHRRRLAIHRLAGRDPGHLRDLRAHRRAPFRRRSGGTLHPHRGAGRHGRLAAARRAHDERVDPLRRGR